MTTTHDMDAAAHATYPTEDAPDVGKIGAFGVTVSWVEHWIENDRHVFRSTEFDLSSEHEDLDCAVSIFIENAEDLAGYLADLMVEGKATDHEAQVAALLFPRLLDLWKGSARSLEDAQSRLVNIRGRRGPKVPSALWRSHSTQPNFKQPSHA